MVVDIGPQVDSGRESTPAAVPLVDEIILCIATVGLSDGSDRPAELLNSESDGCLVDESVFVPEMSPVVSARGAAVPRSLPTISEVFSSAVLARGGGSLLR